VIVRFALNPCAVIVKHDNAMNIYGRNGGVGKFGMVGLLRYVAVILYFVQDCGGAIVAVLNLNYNRSFSPLHNVCNIAKSISAG
jgi:hypothetical protein